MLERIRILEDYASRRQSDIIADGVREGLWPFHTQNFKLYEDFDIDFRRTRYCVEVSALPTFLFTVYVSDADWYRWERAAMSGEEIAQYLGSCFKDVIRTRPRLIPEPNICLGEE